MSEPETQETEAQAPEAEARQQEAEQGIKDVDPLRLLEALLFAATSPLSEEDLRERMPDGADVPALLADTVHFEENAKAQAETMAMGAEIEPLTDEEMATILKTEARDHHNKKLWQYYVSRGLKAGILEKSWELAS